MGLGDMMGKAAGALGGGDFDIMGKLSEMGVDPSALSGMDMESAKAMLAEKGLDLSMLEGLGINPEEMIAKLTGGE